MSGSKLDGASIDLREDRQEASRRDMRRDNAERPRGMTPAAWTFRGGAPIEDVKLERLLMDRETARADRDFGEADRIRDKIIADFGVRMDDRDRALWYGETESAASKKNAPPSPRQARMADRDDRQEQDAVSSQRDDPYASAADDSARALAASLFDDAPQSAAQQQAPAEQPASYDRAARGAELAKLTVSELKAKCKNAALLVGGLKAVLVERLLDASV